MNTYLIDSNVVYQARHAFETRAIEKGVLVNLYRDYADVGDTDLFVTRAITSFPHGNCGLAALYLKSKLGRGEIIQGKYGQSGHTFLLIEGTIVDITADQFNGPKIYIGPLKSPWSLRK